MESADGSLRHRDKSPPVSRAAIPAAPIGEGEWSEASRWWGTGLDRQLLELDVVAESADQRRLLVGEVKLCAAARDLPRLDDELARKATRLPFASHYADVVRRVFVGMIDGECSRPRAIVTAPKMLRFT
jgi:hypothetical protein